jgi:light-regulated signal transduction histidine kinase (bacteriophytochrome)
VSLTGESGRLEDVIPAIGTAGTPPTARLIDLNVVAMDENLVVIGRDVTDRRDAERRIRELNTALDRRAAQLEAANAELESFAYSVAHDLRTPLRAIAGFSDMLGRGGHIRDDDQTGQALLGRATSASARMGELIDALLELAQISRSRLGLTQVDLSAVAGEIAEQLRSSDESRQVDFVIEPGLRTLADLRLVRVLMRSLLENAWKYSGRRERARIEVAQAGPHLFAVHDNGAGFDVEFAEQLFKPFGRLHRQDEFPGTGVGLATAERIVRRHGGTLRGEGRVDQGASFFFSLEPVQDNRQ